MKKIEITVGNYLFNILTAIAFGIIIGHYFVK